MRRRVFQSILSFFVAVAFVLLAFFCTSVFARRPIRSLPSSFSGGGTPSFCADNATPFLAALTGKVSTDSSCADFTSGTYPNYVLPLTPSDKSFTLNVTPVLWGGRETILHLEFASGNANLKLTSFVIGGLTVNPGTNPLAGPGYVVCAPNQNPPSTQVYLLSAIFDSSSTATTNVCTDTSLTFLDASNNSVALEPSPIQFADGNTTRWDIDGISGNSSVSSIDLIVQGFPSDLVDSNPLDVDGGPATPSSNLTQAFMSNANNFLAVAVDQTNGTVKIAGGLSIPSITTPLTNDSIGSATAVDANAAITTAGYINQTNATTAQPQQDSAGNPTNAPTNPPDPPLPSTCFDGGGSSAPLLRTVWYSFAPVGDGSMTIDTAGSRYDTVVAVFTGAPGSLTLLNGTACADDYQDASQAFHLQAKLSNVQVNHGTSYFILVGESPTETGTSISGGSTVAAPLSNDATLFFSLTETLTPAGITLAPANNTGLNFGSVQVGTTSTAQTITVTSTGGTPLSISNISVPAGFNASGCASPVLQGSFCQISLTFQPTTTGTVAGNLTFTDNASGSSPSYPLTGTGTDFTFPQPSQSASMGTPLTSTAAATFSLSASGGSGFSGSITFACQNLPSNTQCAFSPNPASPGSGNTIPVTLTVSRISTAGALPTGWKLNLPFEELLCALLLFVLFLLRSRIARLAPRRFAYGIVLFAFLWMAGCGGGSTQMTPPPPPPATGSYPFTATATVSGAPAKTINLTLTVQ